MSETARGRIPEDEIDLARVARQIGRAAGYPFRLLGRHPLILLLFVICALLAAVSTKYLIARQYKGSFILRPSDKQERFHLQMIGDLDDLRRQGDRHSLARMLGMQESAVSTLQSIEARNPFLQGRKDSVNYTIITLKVSDPAGLTAMQDAIKHYLENSPYFSKIAALQREQVAVQRTMTDKDLLLLDTLKIKEVRRRDPAVVPSQAVIADLADPTRVYAMANERMAKKVALMAQEVFRENFQLVKPVVIPLRHSFPPRILIAAAYLVPVFVILCFFFLVFYENAARRRRTS